MSRLTKDAKPTAFHHMLATIAKEDRLLRLYSQNVDGIDTSLEPLKTCVPLRKDEEGRWPRTVQLHGGLDKMVCSKCQELSDFDPALFSGPVPPLCPNCEEINEIRTTHEGKRSHGIGRLRPRMVLYNEHNPDDEAIGTVTREDLRKRPDAVIVVGTTLKVPGVRRIVREMCGTVRNRRGGVAIWINNDLPPVAKDLEDCFDIVVQSDCDEVAKRAAMRLWDDPAEPDDFSEVSDEDVQKAASKKVEVCVPKCELKSYVFAEPPTARHENNSFLPPPIDATPRKTARPDWSPMPSRRTSVVSVVPSIETDSSSASIEAAENIDVAAPAGLLTPSRSQRSTPVKKVPSINDKLKDASKAKKTAAKTTASNKASKVTATAKAKKPNVKYIKPHASKSKTVGLKPQSGPKAIGLLGAFKASKTASVHVGTAGKKSLASPTNSPSKLRQVSNASEPMNALPPQDARNNASPSKRVAYFPGLDCGSEKKRLFED